MGSRLALLVLLCGLVAACGRTTMKGSLVDEHGSRDETVEMDFWDGLAAERVVTNNDALHALALSFTNSSASTYKARVALARKRGWLTEKDGAPANETAQVGWIARAVCLECKIKGGLTMRLVGPRKRYAVKELNDRGWLPGMSGNQAISGLQFVALLSEAEDYVEERTPAPKEDW